MKKPIIILYLFLIIYSNNLVAQLSSCIKTPFNCTANLVQPQFAATEIRKEADVSYAKPNPNQNQKALDANYVNECIEQQSCLKDGTDLKYDVFYPSGHDYDACPLPVIFLFHPGNFSDCSSKSESATYGGLFAQRGFVAVCVEYRRGVEEDPSGKVSASKTLALYRASQDGRGVIRSVIARQNNLVKTPYKIDFNNIFIGEAGTNPLNIAYINSQDLMDQIAPSAKKILGPINADFYYGDTSVKYKIKGVFNESGGLLVQPSNDMVKLFEQQGTDELPALISFHGAKDGLIALELKYEYFSTEPRYRNEAFCTGQLETFSLHGNSGGTPDLAFLGSLSLFNILTKLKVPCELYVDSEMKHALSSSTGFGTGIKDVNELREYYVQRVATFFQAVINKRTDKLKTKVFLDCENFRQGCRTEDNNDNCNNKNDQNTDNMPLHQGYGIIPLSSY